jgi:hypothetical protein
MLFKSRPAALREQQTAETANEPARSAAEFDPAESNSVQRDRWWYESSYELRSGLDVDDDVSNTLPGELIDQLFKS